MTAPRPNGSIDIWNFVDNVTGTTVRKWLRDSWARRKIIELQQAVGGLVTSEKFATVSGTFAASTGYATTVSYPSGFTKDNTLIISWMVTFGGVWRTGYGAYVDTAGRYFWNLNNDGIQGYNSASSGYNQSWKLVLMRSDI